MFEQLHTLSCLGRGGLGLDELVKEQEAANLLAQKKLREQHKRSLASLEADFLARQKRMHSDRAVMKDLLSSQRACMQLDQDRVCWSFNHTYYHFCNRCS
jgi:hypothetical protein